MENATWEAADKALHEEKINLRHYWHVILERRWLVIAAYCSVFALCLIYLFKATRIYQASTRIQIDRESDNVLNIKDVFSVDGREQDYLQTQYKNLQSRTLIESVVSKLKLDKDPRYAKYVDLSRAVSEDIAIVPIRLSRLIDVKVQHPNPQQAAAIANALVETFIQQNLDQKMSKSMEAVHWLRNEANTLEHDVEEKDLALQLYRVEKKMVSLGESQNIVLQALKQAQADLDKARGEAADAQKLNEEVERLLKSGTSINAIPQVANNPLIQDMRKTLSEREALLANLLKRYKDKYPDVIRVREEITSLKDSIQKESQKLGVAIGLAFFVNYLDDSIKNQDDIETYLRLSFLGYIPNIKTNSVLERDMQAHLHPQSNAAEGFRTLRAAIALAPKADRYRALAVTSTIPAEGKSLVASNLSIVMAQTGLKTLLVDADLRRPSVHKVFRLQSPIGLSSYLTEKVGSVDECIHSTEVPHLDVVCCGAVPSSPSELAGSKRMTQFLLEVRNRYDRVVLDCPPVSAVSDPLIIASLSDGVVFVTKFNKIRRDHARKTVRRIQDAGIFILGVVLNDIDFDGKDSYYYSYYYYQNRYYLSHYSQTNAEPEAQRAKA